ncbi:MAG: hypothetical protein L3J76_03840 [Candidatus Hydrothermae bacterium]|nr:hypothetical protein [Candidatus Hydrothermae bacterium]
MNVNFQNPLVRGFLFALIVPIVILVVGRQYAWKPKDQAIQTARDSVQMLDRKIAQLQRDLQEKARVEKEYKVLLEQWAALKDILPEKEDYPGVLLILHNAAVRSGVEVVRVRRIGATAPTGGGGAAQGQQAAAARAQQRGGTRAAVQYRTLTLDLELKGSFYDIMKFFKVVLSSSRLGKIQNVTLTYERPTSQQIQRRSVKARVRYLVYSFAGVE